MIDRKRLKRAVCSLIILVVGGYYATCGNWTTAALVLLLTTPATSIVYNTGAKMRFFAEPQRLRWRKLKFPEPSERFEGKHFQLQLQRVVR